MTREEKRRAERRVGPACAETLALLRTMKGPAKTSAIARLAGIKNTAMDYRLKNLRTFGLAASIPNASGTLWKAV